MVHLCSHVVLPKSSLFGLHHHNYTFPQCSSSPARAQLWRSLLLRAPVLGPCLERRACAAEPVDLWKKCLFEEALTQDHTVVKLDCEGAEIEILETHRLTRLDTEVLQKVRPATDAMSIPIANPCKCIKSKCGS